MKWLRNASSYVNCLNMKTHNVIFVRIILCYPLFFTLMNTLAYVCMGSSGQAFIRVENENVFQKYYKFWRVLPKIISSSVNLLISKEWVAKIAWQNNTHLINYILGVASVKVCHHILTIISNSLRGFAGESWGWQLRFFA